MLVGHLFSLFRSIHEPKSPSLTPTVFIPLHYLSYASVIGIASTILIIFAVVFDGLSKREAPGSLWQPEPTQWFVWRKIELGTAFGLFMAGVSVIFIAYRLN